MKKWWLLMVLAAVCGGCATPPALERVADIGPYRVHWVAAGAEGEDLLLLTRDGNKLYGKSGNKRTVYAEGQALFDFSAVGAGETVGAYMVHIRDADGNVAFTLMDENADGEYDRKIDYGTQAVYEWKNGQWETWK